MKSVVRTVILVIIGLAVILLGGMCSSRIEAQGPALVTFISRTQTADRVTYDYAVTAAGTVASIAIDGPCLLDSGGLAVRYNGSEQITLLETGFVRGLDGAKITIKYAPTVYTVVGVWVSAEYPGGLAANSRWALFPLDAYTEGNPTPYVQTVPQCDASPVVLPVVLSGSFWPESSAEWAGLIAILVILAFTFILLGERKPRPPHQKENRRRD